MAWHELYDDPSSVLSARLRLVRAQLSDALDHAPAGPVRLLSLCAGQGRDVIGVLSAHPRRDDVSAVLIEADPENAETTRREAPASHCSPSDRGPEMGEARHEPGDLITRLVPILVVPDLDAERANLEAGEATESYRVGGDVLVTDADGTSFISGADFALAFVDEIEQGRHRRERFTVAYRAHSGAVDRRLLASARSLPLAWPA